MSNTTLTTLEQQAAEMQAKLDEMKAAIEQQRKEQEKSVKSKENLFGFGVPEMKQEYWAVNHDTRYGVEIYRMVNFAGYGTALDYRFAFTNKEKAQLMAEAFQVLIELRMCKGVVAGVPNCTQFIIKFSKNGIILGDCWDSYSGFLSPFFATTEDRNNAINTVGEERIRKAFLTLQGTFE